LDPTCQAIRSYLATGHATPVTGSDSLRTCRWIQRETPFLRVFEGGLLYRVDPVSPEDTRPELLKQAAPPRLWVPEDLRPAFLHAFHERFGHPGATRMTKVLRERYYWPGPHADVVTHVKECHDCTMGKRLTRSLSSPERSRFGAYPHDNLTVDVVYMGHSGWT
jgi:hypothetical protein